MHDTAVMKMYVKDLLLIHFTALAVDIHMHKILKKNSLILLNQKRLLYMLLWVKWWIYEQYIHDINKNTQTTHKYS